MATISGSLTFQDKMSGVIQKVSNALDKATQATEKAKQEMEDMTYAYGASSKEAIAATMAYAKSKNEMDSLTATLEKAKQDQEELARAEREAALQATFQSKGASILNKAMGGLKEIFTGVAGRIAGATKIIDMAINAIINTFNRFVQATKEALHEYSRFQSSLVDVTNLLDRNDTSFMKNSKALQQASKEAIKLGISTEDANTALFNSVSAIGDVETSIKAYKSAQILAKAGATDLSTSINGLTNVINAYRLSADEANDVSTAFFRAQVVGKTTVGELANAIGGVAPIAKSAGVGYQELLATMSVLTKGGLDTASAATALRASMTALIKPSKQAEEVLRAYGVPVGAAELQSKGLTYALVQLQKAAEANPDVMAEMIPNIRALTGVSTLTADSIALVDKTIQDMNSDIANGTGLMDAYNKKLNTLEDSEKKLKGAKENLARAWGQLLSPIAMTWNKLLTFIIDKTAWLIDGMNKIGDSVSNLWGKITGKGNKKATTNNLTSDYDTTMKKWHSLQDKAKSMGLDTSGSISKLEKRISDAENKQKPVIKASGSGSSGIEKYAEGGALKTKQQGDISIKRENLELLHDLATEKFAQYYQQLTPTLTIPNMVIHETADVNEVLGAITSSITGFVRSSTYNTDTGSQQILPA